MEPLISLQKIYFLQIIFIIYSSLLDYNIVGPQTNSRKVVHVLS